MSEHNRIRHFVGSQETCGPRYGGNIAARRDEIAILDPEEPRSRWPDDLRSALASAVVVHLEMPAQSLGQIAELQKQCVEIKQELAELKTVVAQALAHRLPVSSVVDRFNALMADWKKGRGHSSKIRDLAMHPAYQQIIGMGEPAVPLLLKEMGERPDYWMWALRAITGVNPIAEGNRGKLKEIAQAWVKWGKDNRYSW